jgi:hypothetical protein
LNKQKHKTTKKQKHKTPKNVQLGMPAKAGFPRYFVVLILRMRIAEPRSGDGAKRPLVFVGLRSSEKVKLKKERHLLSSTKLQR